MPKGTGPLTPQEVRVLPPGRHADGDGLYLLVRVRAAKTAEGGEPVAPEGGEPEQASEPAWWLFLCFVWREGDAHDGEIVDYHGG